MLLGLFIIKQAFGMPMKDSWGGVQNVWYVSPALFPLLVGGMLTFLGLLLISIALKTVGAEGVKSVFSFVLSSSFVTFLRQPEVVRFYGIVANLMVFVFIMVPRVDFFLGAVLFLLVCFFMFYLQNPLLLLKVFWFILSAALLLVFYFSFGLGDSLFQSVEFTQDWIVMGLILSLCFFVGMSIRGDVEVVKKYRLSMIIAFAAPLTIGVIFKYFLLVPMPGEGWVVQLLDSIWYADMWS